MVLMLHPTGNANVREAARALADAQLLEEFWTCISWNPAAPINRLLPQQLRQQLSRRALPQSVQDRTRHAPLREVGRMLSPQLGLSALSRHESGIFSVDAVYRSLDRKVAARLSHLDRIQAVYAYEDGAAECFRAAAKCGFTRIYDLPIGYWRAGHAIYDEEKAREPAWACTLSGTRDSAAKLARKDEELQLANAVIVASSFTKSTLAFSPSPAREVEVIPYGAPSSIAERSLGTNNGKLRVLFAGALGQRKGLSYLLRAINMTRAGVELTLIGRKISELCDPLNEAVKQHRWIPSLPHSEMLREMARHDVFVFPSLFEGFGLVILEAMSQGLPVITTAHTAGPDIIRDGEDGFIVPIRDPAAIAEKLDKLASDRALLRDMMAAAQATAARFTWEAYRVGLVNAVKKMLKRSDNRTRM